MNNILLIFHLCISWFFVQRTEDFYYDEVRKQLISKLTDFGVDFEAVAEEAKIRTDKYFEVKK